MRQHGQNSVLLWQHSYARHMICETTRQCLQLRLTDLSATSANPGISAVAETTHKQTTPHTDQRMQWKLVCRATSAKHTACSGEVCKIHSQANTQNQHNNITQHLSDKR
jgi:hypothetical protein